MASSPHADSTSRSGRPFEPDPGIYDALVDWAKRLANEEPFYRRLWEAVGVRRVLDAACGTGRHAAWFHSWGLEVEGADLDPRMIAFCRSAHGEDERLRWVERDFSTPPSPPGTFDAVICVGNSLALVADLGAVQAALRGMLAALRPGGVCVTQTVNLARVPEGPVNWQKCVRLGGDGPVLLKGMHRVGEKGYVEFIELRLDAGKVKHEARTAVFLGLRESDLISAARAVGADEARVFGDFHEARYDPASSPDLVLVCRRASK